MVWPLSFRFSNCSVSINCYYSSLTILFLLLLLPFFVMGGKDCRGRGKRKVTRGVLFLFCLLPIWPKVYWKAIAQCVAVGQGGGGILSSFSLCIWFGFLSKRQQRLRSSTCLSPPAFIFPSSLSQSGWRDVGRNELVPSGKQRPAGVQAGSNSAVPQGLLGELTQDSQSTKVLIFFLLCRLFLFAAALLGAVCLVD